MLNVYMIFDILIRRPPMSPIHPSHATDMLGFPVDEDANSRISRSSMHPSIHATSSIVLLALHTHSRILPRTLAVTHCHVT